jgi:hypothetical protein
MDRGRERGAPTSVGPDDRPCAGCIMLRGHRAVKDEVALGDGAGSKRTPCCAAQLACSVPDSAGGRARLQVGLQKAGHMGHDSTGDFDLTDCLVPVQWRLAPGIARADGIGSECVRCGKVGVNAGGDWLSQREQFPDFVCLAEVDLMSDKQSLQRLLGSLLGMEAGGVVRGHLGAEN